MRASLVAALLLAGCVAPADPTAPASVVDDAVLGVTEAIRISATQPAREPSIVAAPDGTLYVAGYWGHIRYTERGPGDADNALLSPLAWRSRDAGATWERLPTGNVLAGAQGNSDVALDVDSAGRVWLASLVFRPIPLPLGLLSPDLPFGVTVSTVAVGVSDDAGDTWSWAEVVTGPYVDRPWVRVGADGTAHAVWNDQDGVHYATSSDGAAWSAPARIADQGGAGGFAVRPDGALAVRVGQVWGSGYLPIADVDGLLVSEGGTTWTMRDLPGERTWGFDANGEPADGIPRVWDPVAFDPDGRACVAWAEEKRLLLACSDDLGATWDEPRAIADGSLGQPYFPFLRGTRTGLVASWFAGAEDAASAHAALVTAEGVAAVVLDDDTGSRDHGEYFEVVQLADGALAAAVPIADAGQWLEFRRTQ